MKKFNFTILLLFLLILGFSISIYIPTTHAADNTYYVSTMGVDSISGGTSNNPWKTFAFAIPRLSPGDTLILKDGTYNGTNQSNPTVLININKSGSAGSPITLKAENDGKAIIDGESIRHTFWLRGQSYWNFEGFVVKNAGKTSSPGSTASVFSVSNARNLNFKRVSGYNSDQTQNSHIFDVSYSSYILFEDCAASGLGRTMWTITESDHIILRRSWGMVMGHSGGGGPLGLEQTYGSDDVIVENFVGTSQTTQTMDGISTWANYYNPTANRNKYYGNVVYGDFRGDWSFKSASAKYRIGDDLWVNNVGIGNRYGFLNRGNADLNISNLTLINSNSLGLWASHYPCENDSSCGALAADYQVNTTIKNSVLSSGGGGTALSKESHPKVNIFAHSFNNLYGFSTLYSGTTAGIGEINLNPTYDTVTYGKGAYLLRPSNLKGKGEGGADIGAEVLYRYQDGTLTATPLWPWAMEQRICAETGYSATYENGYAGCANGGGIWKTLNGIYLATLTPTPTPTPSPTPTSTFSKCDQNHDNSINVLDLQSLANVILGKSTCTYLCDLNQDNSTNVLDLQYLANVILGKSSCP